MDTPRVLALAREAGFELAGIAPAEPHPDSAFYLDWVRAGYAARMGYLTDYRAGRRTDPHSLLPEARTILCVGLRYDGPAPRTSEFDGAGRGWISRYAWGEDYHLVIRRKLESLLSRMQTEMGQAFPHQICVDTAPLLERSYAMAAGLGWIGRNKCLIHPDHGSFFFLGEVLWPLDLEPAGPPVGDHCGTCTACIEACPTGALVPHPAGDRYEWALDSARCLSYLTIELKGAPIPEDLRPAMGSHIFGCDICQDVCPWNRAAPLAGEAAFAARQVAPPLDRLAAMSEHAFAAMFRHTPLERLRYARFLRNVVVAMGNSPRPEYVPILRRLRDSSGPGDVPEHAAWALRQVTVGE